MKHSVKITLLLLAMFFIAQLIGLAVIGSYNSYSQGTLPEWIEPPKDITPNVSLVSIIIAIVFGVILMLVLMSFKAEMFLRLWFFLVVAIAIAITLNALISFLSPSIKYSFMIALIISIPLAFVKIFIRNIKVHNFTE